MNKNHTPESALAAEPSRRERKKDETRSRIFHAAIDLFRERGFESTTVDQITERADVARGTFFNYFPRKDAVLAYLSEIRLVSVEEDASAMLAEPRPAPEKLVDLYVSAALAYEDDRELSRFVIIELMARFFAPSEDLGMRWQSQIVRLVRQGQELGQITGALAPERIEGLLSGIYYATLYQWACLEQVPISLREEMAMRLGIALRGLAR